VGCDVWPQLWGLLVLCSTISRVVVLKFLTLVLGQAKVVELSCCLGHYKIILNMQKRKSASLLSHQIKEGLSKSPKPRKPLYPFTDKKPPANAVVPELNFDSGSYSLF